MRGMPGGGIGMQAERGSRGGGLKATAAALPKPKPSFKRLWPQIWSLLRPRMGLVLLGLLLTAIRSVAGLTVPYISKFFIDKVVAAKPPQIHLIPMFILIVLGATLIQAIGSYTLTQLLSVEGQKLIAELRRRVQRHIGLLSVSFYDENRSGTLVARIMTDVEGIRNIIGTGLVEFFGGSLTAILVFAYLMHRSALVTLSVFAVIFIFTFFLQMGFKTIRPIFRERGKINAEVTGRLTESLGGVRVIKGYHAEEREHDVFSQGVQRLLDNVMKSLKMTSALSSISTVIIGIVSAIVMYLGAHSVFVGQWSLGDYFSYNLFLVFMIAPVLQIVNIGTQLTEALAGLDRTNEILHELEENADPARTEQLPPINGTVEFENVVFAYQPEKPVLHGISFTATPGSVTALVGSSGSGKSTIISLVCAFHTPRTGRILVDGHDISHVNLDTFRSQLGVVLQDSFLFDGTIRENVMFSRPSASVDEFWAACRTARVDEFAERFPEQYETIVGERGVKLSGGQRQRLSIARALLANPRILILDEATSSLDSESEAMIQAGLAKLMEGRTTFVIAHRLSTIRRADQILVVEEGRIVERGNHEQLYAQGGRYYDLYTRQHGLEANLFLAPGEGDTVDVS